VLRIAGVGASGGRVRVGGRSRVPVRIPGPIPATERARALLDRLSAILYRLTH
jgi:hypothetical protein